MIFGKRKHWAQLAQLSSWLCVWMLVSAGLLVAAEVLIENAPSITVAEHSNAGNTVVFTTDSVGYAFFTSNDGTCYYRKTTDEAVSWGSAVQVNSLTDCTNLSVWYDQWTPGDTGSHIHIVSMHASSNELRYNRLDTSSDTLLTTPGATAVASNGQTPTLSVGANVPTITKGTDGTVYVAIADNGDAFINECSSGCNISGNWSETGTNPLDTATGDLQLLVPLLGGEVMIISRDRSADDVRSKVWDNTSWDAGWTIVDTNAGESSDYELALSAVTNPVTGRVHLAYVSDHNNFFVADHDIRTAYYDGGTWTAGSDIVTNDTRGITEIAVVLDENTGDVFAMYGARSTITVATTTDIFWASSGSAMASWSIDNGPLNVGQDDFYGLSTNHMSADRLYGVWYEDTTNDIRGETIFDIVPPLTATATGTQEVEVRGGSTNFYVGGSFVLQEFGGGRDITSITLTENGSVDGAVDLDNIRILYDTDTTAPHDCASESFDGSEPQFGATDTNGFSGANGVATFADTVTVTASTTLCAYVLLDVLATAVDGQTIDIQITDPSSDVLVSGTIDVAPTTVEAIDGDTTVVYPRLVQTGYHWRNDDGTESTASSATGAENTPRAALTRGTPSRLRVAVSNDGSTSTDPTTLRLEYGIASPACTDVSVWTDVDQTDDDWNMDPGSSLIQGLDTTNIATINGGVTDPNTTFLSANSGQLETTSQTSALTYATSSFAEFEFALVASTTATEGASYCFRLTDGGTPLQYNQYPQASIAADVTVAGIGTQITSADIGASTVYAGGAFSFVEAGTARSVTNITITESGSVDAATDLQNIVLRYDFDQTAPYDCASESYSISDAQFGATVPGGFSGANGTAAFSDSVPITSTSSLCVYVQYDVESSAQNGDTVEISITDPNTEIAVTGSGTVAPSSPVELAGTTVLSGAIMTQVHYHWRNDDGSETGATSATGGSEDTAITEIQQTAAYRLRIGLSNEGGTSTPAVSYTLQFGIKSTTCDVVGSWTDVDATAGDSWDMLDSTFVTHGADTTNIPVVDGGVSDEESSFFTPNGGVRELSASTPTTTIGSTNFVDYEFSLTTTVNTPFETAYCFRLVENGQPLTAYDVYPEATIRANRDFRIQRGTNDVVGNALTLTAGVDYDAPSSTSSAFVRITNAHHTGAGNTTGGGNLNPDDVAAYITTSDLTSSFTIARIPGAFGDTRVSWEIIEFVGLPGTDNEMIVRDIGTVSLAAATLQATATAVSVTDPEDVVVFVTGARIDTNRRDEYDNLHVTADWASSTNQAVFTRDTADYDLDAAYAVVEFVGQNWNVQRVEHTFASAGVAETASITPVGSVSRAFIEGQKRMQSNNLQTDFGVEMWLSSMGAVSLYLDPNASNPSQHTAVVWVIENTQTGTGEMQVFRTNGTTSGGAEPLTVSVVFDATGVSDLENASIYGFTTLNGMNTFFPRVMAGLTLTSTTTYELFRSDTGDTLSYRTAIIEWPTAEITFTQNYYHWYENGGLTPTSPWPPTGVDIGENSPITLLDTPVGEGDVLRLRTSIQVNNANLPANLESFKLQYRLLPEAQSCSGLSGWSDVGASGSGVVWRGFDNGAVADNAALGSNPPVGGQLLLSVADRAGRYVENGVASVNPYTVTVGEDVEYDWVIQHNGATQRSDYCFRVVDASGNELDAYNFYPQLRTQGYSPEQADWRWYDDAGVSTPIEPLASENVAPVEITKGNTLKLRVVVDEINNLAQTDARFRLQFSDNPSFSTVNDVVSTGACQASDIWCYDDGGGVDNALVDSALLSSADSCVAATGTGCGTHHESPLALTGFTHQALAATEFEFTIQYQEVPGYYGQVWYFRLYDVANNDVVPLAGGASYPSVVGESGSIVFTIGGLPSGTSTENIVTNASSTAVTIPFGTLLPDTDVRAAQRIGIDTNALGGYQVTMYTRQALLNENGDEIAPIAGSNAAPVSWTTGCAGQSSCFAYHAGDDTLSGDAARFALDDTYAAASTTPFEIMYSASPTTDQHDVIYRVVVDGTHPAGLYTTDIVYVTTPVF